MLQRPSSLHIPTLYEECSSELFWASVNGATGYQVECVFGESFERAGAGRSWTALDAAEESWAQIEFDGLSWAQLEVLPAQGLTWGNIEYSNKTWDTLDAQGYAWREIERLPASFLIFSGMGTPIRALDQGLTWNELASRSLSWNENEAEDLCWQEFELLPCTGLTWSQLDSNGLSWLQFEERKLTWRGLAEIPARGLPWESLDALYLPWSERDAKALTWDAFEHLSTEHEMHLAFTTAIPLYRKLAYFRVRAFDGVDYSEYISSTPQKINPRSLAKYRPPCLHIPELHEIQSAQISWGELYGASNYVLEQAFTEGFAVRYQGAGSPTEAPIGCNAWNELWYTPDCKRHFSFTDTLPAGERQVVYRIKGRNTTDESQCLASAVVPIIPVFYREDSVNMQVVAGAGYTVQLHARSIEAFKEIVMRLLYSSELLALEQFAAEQPTAKTDMGSTAYTGNARELSRKEGEIRFLCTRAMEDKKEWNGLVVCVRFRALRTGHAKVELL